MAYKDPKDRKKYAETYYARNRDKVRASQAKRWQDNKEQLRARALYHPRYRAKKLAKIYKADVDEIHRLLEIVVCEICGIPATDIDHNHKNGVLRGRLCTNCNNGLGRFKDRPELLIAAAIYLQERR